MTDKDKYFQESISSGIPTYYFLLRDFGVGKGCKNFVETGTHLGNGVQYALDNGFDEVLSCEMMQDRYQHCMDRFKDNDNVSLWLGKSDDCFSEMVSKLTEKSCFWLDAHAEGGGVPTFEELGFRSSRCHLTFLDGTNYPKELLLCFRYGRHYFFLGVKIAPLPYLAVMESFTAFIALLLASGSGFFLPNVLGLPGALL